MNTFHLGAKQHEHGHILRYCQLNKSLNFSKIVGEKDVQSFFKLENSVYLEKNIQHGLESKSKGK